MVVYNNVWHNQYLVTIDHLYVSKNILITFIIAVTSRLDAVDACKNVLYPMGFR